jgi:hypothetical protein
MAWALQQENMPGTASDVRSNGTATSLAALHARTAASDMRSNGGARQLARLRYTRERLPEKSNLIWVC